MSGDYFDYNIDNDSNNEKTSSGNFFKGALVGALAVVLVLATIVAILFKLDIVTIGRGADAIGGSSGSFAEKAYDKISTIERMLESFYFDEVDDETVLDNICKAYLDSYGDKYTVYFDHDEYNSLLESSSGSFVGIGVLVSKNEDGTIKAEKVYDGSPAQKGGVKDGDFIISIDGISVTDEDLDASVARIKGEKGTQVTIEVKRKDGGAVQKLVLERDVVEYEMVFSEMLENDIGYIEISQFADVTFEQFKEAYDDCLSKGAKGIVIDVRDNPGGLLTSVCDTLDMLVPDGLLVYTEEKDGKRTDYKGKNSAEAEVPLVVLVNENSASASEIFAGCLQDYKKATIVGTTTFGKGIVQSVIGLNDGTAIKFTTSKYFTPLGQDIHGNGVKPDVVIEYDFEAVSGKEEITYKDDNQVMKAIEVLRGKIR